MKSRVPAMQSVGGNPVRSAKIGEIWGLWRSWFRTYSENCSELPASAGRKKNSESPMRLKSAVPVKNPRALGFFTGTADLSRIGDSEFFFRSEEHTSELQPP